MLHPTTLIKIILQKNGNQSRAIIELGNPKNPTSNQSGDYYVIDTNDIDTWGISQAQLNSGLKENGLGEYTYFLRDSNIKVNIDSQHNNNSYSSYIGFDSKGNMTVTPILYKGDNVQLVNGNYFEGIWWDEKVDLTFEPRNLSKPLTTSSSNSKTITNYITKMGIKVK